MSEKMDGFSLDLLSTSPLYEYDSNNKATDKQIGVRYECCEVENNYEKFITKVGNITPVITNEQIKEIGQVWITFDPSFEAKFYRDRNGNYALMCKAEKAVVLGREKG